MAASTSSSQGVVDLEAGTRPHSSASTSLAKAKQTASFLLNPADQANAPARRRTRALLRSFRYITIFLFWRLVRYAKYAAVGAVTAAIAGTAIGSVASGAAFIIAPPGIFAGAGIGLLWGLGKFGWRMMARRVRTGESDHADPRLDEKAEHAPREEVRPPRADPW